MIQVAIWLAVFGAGLFVGFAACALLTVGKVTDLESRASQILTHMGVTAEDAEGILEWLENGQEADDGER